MTLVFLNWHFSENDFFCREVKYMLKKANVILWRVDSDRRIMGGGPRIAERKKVVEDAQLSRQETSKSTLCAIFLRTLSPISDRSPYISAKNSHSTLIHPIPLFPERLQRSMFLLSDHVTCFQIYQQIRGNGSPKNLDNWIGFGVVSWLLWR